MKITIPQPCHQNWQNMTSVEKGRFCGACQKKVHDFTKLSDRAILDAYKEDAMLCGRFLPSQLDRELSAKKETGKNWMGAAAGVLLISSVAGTDAIAQEATPTEQHADKQNVILGEPAVQNTVTVSGTVLDKDNKPFPGCNIALPDNPRVATTDSDGHFSITVRQGTSLMVSNLGYMDAGFLVTDERPLEIKMIADVQGETIMMTSTIGMLVSVKKRTFLGRIFHAIGNIFR